MPGCCTHDAWAALLHARCYAHVTKHCPGYVAEDLLPRVAPERPLLEGDETHVAVAIKVRSPVLCATLRAVGRNGPGGGIKVTDVCASGSAGELLGGDGDIATCMVDMETAMVLLMVAQKQKVPQGSGEGENCLGSLGEVDVLLGYSSVPR